MSEVFSSFRSLRAGSQVFVRLILFLYVILHTMPLDRNMQLLCILPFDMFCLSAISMMFVKIMLAVCILVGYGSLSESGPCVFRELCPVSFLVVGECP